MLIYSAKSCLALYFDSYILFFNSYFFVVFGCGFNVSKLYCDICTFYYFEVDSIC